ncbi:MAG: hypothetical protein EOO40_12465, partial [Deltaproteobacteria bacterium]
MVAPGEICWGHLTACPPGEGGMAQSRFGRNLRQPDRYDPETFASDDETDEDESVSLPDSITTDSTGSLDGFVVGEEDDEEATLD